MRIRMCLLFVFMFVGFTSARVTHAEPLPYSGVTLILPGTTGCISSELVCNDLASVRDIQGWALLRFRRFIDIDRTWRPDPFTRSYDPLLEQFEFWGEDTGEEAVIACYDWRLSVDEIVEEYMVPVIQSRIPEGQSFSIAGHSLGGLVALAIAERYGEERIFRVSLIGSPVTGIPDAYLLRAGGKTKGQGVLGRISTGFLFEQVTDGCNCEDERIVNVVRGCVEEVDGELVQKTVPWDSLLDMYPIEPFLFPSEEAEPIPLNDMCEENTFLRDLHDSGILQELGDRLRFFGSNSRLANKEIILREGTTQDCDRLRWPDGVPSRVVKEVGDGRVPTSSWCPEEFDVDLDQCEASSRSRHNQLQIAYAGEVACWHIFGGECPGTTTTTLPPVEGITLVPTVIAMYDCDEKDVRAYLEIDGIRDVEVTFDPRTVFTVEDENVARYQNGHVISREVVVPEGERFATTKIHVSHDPDGDGPAEPFRDSGRIQVSPTFVSCGPGEF